MSSSVILLHPDDDVAVCRRDVHGAGCRHVDVSSAAKAIVGFCVCNDISERAFQMDRGGQWDKGKGCDSFGPIGPWLVTADEVDDPNDLDMWLDVNGTRFQSGFIKTMIFPPAFLISYVSQFMSLQPGDIVDGYAARSGAGPKTACVSKRRR